MTDSPRHILDVDDLDSADLLSVLNLAERPGPQKVLADRAVALLFEKPSNRTRVSMEVAVMELGGHPVTIRADEIGLDVRETVEDVARVLASYSAVIGARVFEHSKLIRLAAASSVPVVNLLSDHAHPCQAFADVLTLRQVLGGLEGKKLAYVGDGNNVCRSLMKVAALTGLDMRVATPPGYEPSGGDDAHSVAAHMLTNDPRAAVEGADAVYTDVWASMGQEDEATQRQQDFAGFQVDDELMALAGPNAVFMHCLPVHRGLEVTASVVDGERSVVWRQAANRLAAQRGLLLWLMGSA